MTLTNSTKLWLSKISDAEPLRQLTFLVLVTYGSQDADIDEMQAERSLVADDRIGGQRVPMRAKRLTTRPDQDDDSAAMLRICKQSCASSEGCGQVEPDAKPEDSTHRLLACAVKRRSDPKHEACASASKADKLTKFTV